MAKNVTVEVRQIHFGADGVGIGIIGKDHLEQGAHELAAAFKSNLAARYRLVDGAVTDAFPGKTDEQVIAALEKAEAERAAALVAARGAKPLVVTKLDFMNLFDDAELAKVYAGAKQSIALEIYLDKLKVADEVDLNDARTIAGLAGLKEAGILTDERIAAIRSNRRPA